MIFPVFLRARVATESASFQQTLCRGSGLERECGGSCRVFRATERQDTWPWGNHRCVSAVRLTYSALFLSNLMFSSFHTPNCGEIWLSKYLATNFNWLIVAALCYLCYQHNPVQSCRELEPRPAHTRCILVRTWSKDWHHYYLRVSLSSPQICVGKLEDGEVFLKLSSGKKRGLVPADSIEEIWGPELTSLFFSYTSYWDALVAQPLPSPSYPTFAPPGSPDLNQTDGNCMK